MGEKEREQFFEQYAPIAIEQQQKFGIPASVTLSQMALESAWGQSRLARAGNNYFGIKAHDEYLSTGHYGLYSDDCPNEKFCHYATVEQSVLDHSRILITKPAYSSCRQLSSTDYRGWLSGLKNGNYATSPSYVKSCTSIIEKYNLDKYDRIAVSQAIRPIGYLRDDAQAFVPESSVSQRQQRAGTYNLAYLSGQWCMPVVPDNGDKIRVTSPYGIRDKPNDRASRNHMGLDIGVNHVGVYATENNGVITEVAYDSSSGNYIKVRYNRADGSQYETSYLHLSEVNVKVGDSVQAGARIGVSGNSGNSTGPHLHFGVKQFAEGQWKSIDPSLYLAEISVRGGLSTSLEDGQRDLLAQYKTSMSVINHPESQAMPLEHVAPSQFQLLSQVTQSDHPSDWLSYLMNKDTNKDGLSLGASGDVIADIAGALLSSTLMLVSQLNGLDSIDPELESSLGSHDREKDETYISESTLIQRQRDSIDPLRAQQMSSINFEVEIPQTQQTTSQKIS